MIHSILFELKFQFDRKFTDTYYSFLELDKVKITVLTITMASTEKYFSTKQEILFQPIEYYSIELNKNKRKSIANIKRIEYNVHINFNGCFSLTSLTKCGFVLFLLQNCTKCYKKNNRISYCN